MITFLLFCPYTHPVIPTAISIYTYVHTSTHREMSGMILISDGHFKMVGLGDCSIFQVFNISFFF